MEKLFHEINECRANPVAYAKKLNPDWYKGTVLYLPDSEPSDTSEGQSALASCIEELRRSQPLPRLRWEEGLVQAADAHAKDIGTRGLMGHKGSDNSLPEQRLSRFGTWELKVGENIDYIHTSPESIVITWLIDDGEASRPNRKSILDPQFSCFGASLQPHSDFDFTCVALFTAGFTLPNLSRQLSSPTKTNQIKREEIKSEKPQNYANKSEVITHRTSLSPVKNEGSNSNTQASSEKNEEVTKKNQASPARNQEISKSYSTRNEDFTKRAQVSPAKNEESRKNTQVSPAKNDDTRKNIPVSPVRTEEAPRKAEIYPRKTEEARNKTEIAPQSTVKTDFQYKSSVSYTNQAKNLPEERQKNLEKASTPQRNIPDIAKRASDISTNPSKNFERHNDVAKNIGRNSGEIANRKEPVKKVPEIPKRVPEIPKKLPEVKKNPAKGKNINAKTKTDTNGLNLTEEEIEMCKKSFDLFDMDSSGSIDPREVTAVLNSFPNKNTPMFKLLEGIEDLETAITYQEFLEHISYNLGNRYSRDGIKQIIKLFDHHGTGSISKEDFSNVLHKLGESFSDADIHSVFQKCTTDGENISIDDLYSVLTKNIHI